MAGKKKERHNDKAQLHRRSKHNRRYDFDQLVKASPELGSFVKPNKYKDLSIDFFDPQAVKALNIALLRRYYGIVYWDVPAGYLCPPIPGRAEYVHLVADLLAKVRGGHKDDIPRGPHVKVVDIGVGANCIYPIIGQSEYGWSFVGSDIDKTAVANAIKVITSNNRISEDIDIRLQKDSKNILESIVKGGEQYDLCISNPPFHASKEDAQGGTIRKLKNLKGKDITDPVLNFGGQSNELWCEGGEVEFIKRMIFESKKYRSDILWFSTLVSKEQNLDAIYELLEEANVADLKRIPIRTGNKKSRIVAWTFFSDSQQKAWANFRWIRSK